MSYADWNTFKYSHFPTGKDVAPSLICMKTDNEWFAWFRFVTVMVGCRMQTNLTRLYKDFSSVCIPLKYNITSSLHHMRGNVYRPLCEVPNSCRCKSKSFLFIIDKLRGRKLSKHLNELKGKEKLYKLNRHLSIICKIMSSLKALLSANNCSDLEDLFTYLHITQYNWNFQLLKNWR